MAELSFIDGTPDHISIDDLVTGAREVRDILEGRAEYGDDSDYTEDDEREAREDFEALKEILSEAGYPTETPEDVVSALETLDSTEGPTLTERDSVEERARDLYEDDTWPSIIAGNINWDGIVEDMLSGTTEVTINNGTYYPL